MSTSNDKLVRQMDQERHLAEVIRSILPTDEDCENEDEQCRLGAGKHWIHASAGHHGVVTEVDANVNMLAGFIWDQTDLARRKASLPSWSVRYEVSLDRLPTWELKVGRIRTSPEQVLVVLEQPNVMIFEIDLDSKYPGLFLHESCGEGRRSVVILPDEDTIKLDETATTDTEFILRGAEGWTIMADGSRYTVRIVAYRRLLPSELPGIG